MEYVITEHAARRFVKRISQISLGQAYDALGAIAPTSIPMAEFPPGDGEYRRALDPDCVLICKREDGRMIVVTVIRVEDVITPDVAEIVDAFRRQHAQKIQNVLVNKGERHFNHMSQSEFMDYVAACVNDEIHARSNVFVEEQKRQDAQRESVIRRIEKERALRDTTESQVQAALEKVRLREERIRSELQAKVECYDAMVQELIPGLYKLAKTNEDALRLLMGMVDHVPSLAGVFGEPNKTVDSARVP